MKNQIKVLVFLGIEPMERVFAIENILKRIKNVTRICEVTGEFELFIEVVAETSKDVGELLSKISVLKGVRSIQTFVVTKQIKDVYERIV